MLRPFVIYEHTGSQPVHGLLKVKAILKFQSSNLAQFIFDVTNTDFIWW